MTASGSDYSYRWDLFVLAWLGSRVGDTAGGQELTKNQRAWVLGMGAVRYFRCTKDYSSVLGASRGFGVSLSMRGEDLGRGKGHSKLLRLSWMRAVIVTAGNVS